MEKQDSGNSFSLTDAEYIRMRESEDSSYKYHGADTEETDKENADDGYPEVVEHNESGSVYDLKTDFMKCKKNIGICASGFFIFRLYGFNLFLAQRPAEAI